MDACSSGHALVLASWEKNSEAWLDGRFFELRSRKQLLQDRVSNGGTLWIVVSRPSRHGRLYTLSFRLNECRPQTYSSHGRFGRYAVVGDHEKSRFLATADAKLLLLALRFDPVSPINGPADNQVSNSIRVPRCLSPADVGLLDEYATRSDRWSVFISYRQASEGALAGELSEALQREGVSVFRDQEGLRGGEKWWPTLKRAISRSRRLVVLIGPTTQQSTWVHSEIQHALDEGVRIVPVLAGGDFTGWGALRTELSSRHCLDLADGIEAVVAGLLA
jgi:hypothetical protein